MYARMQRFNLSQGLVEVAERLADRVEVILRTQPGFGTLTLLSDESSGEYLFLTLWDRLEDLAAFDRSRDEWRVRDIMSEHLVTVPQIGVYQMHAVPVATEAAVAPLPG